MSSGLYGDLPEAKNQAGSKGSEGGGWAQKPKFAPPVRKPGMLGAPRAVLGSAKRPAREAEGRPPPDPSRTGSGGHSLAGAQLAGNSGLLGSAGSNEQFADEYDPARPNEYEAVRKDKERLRKQAEEEADRQEELRLLQEQDRMADMNAAAAPGPSAEDRRAALSLSGEEAFLRRGRLGKAGGAEVNAQGGGSFAQRMMQNMGWKEGLGLGKSHQGITTPLEAQKTDRRSGVIKAADQLPRAGGSEEGGGKARGVSIQGTPSRVVLLRNIVGPGEVDDSLEDEIGEECSKYGSIGHITIFEVTEPGFDPTEAVRIFVQFERAESAMKALIDLDGRFFGGRTVKAMFFPEERLDAQDLAPRPGQPD